ncbi:terpene cyclase/mutase family protein [Kitasatospora albolonga]|uniref:prenyltransferase/squalene oxidase repeat-containing protein n=1 Tax=Kitasatospora albolonga TaxID=68173 RepID=UPI0031F0F353
MLTTARAGAALATTALATAALLAGTAAPALADTPSASPSPVAAPAEVYGKGDPTYDGVWRQSLALTALAATGVVPADAAVNWLTGQQCADGGWPSFRADTSSAAATTGACDPKAEDTNATAMAVQALSKLDGHQNSVSRGVEWLKKVQNADGSWAYNPGNPGDANSTGLAVSALLTVGTDPATVAKDGKTAYDGLALFQLGCAAPVGERGAFGYQPLPDGSLAPNGLASAQAALAAAGGKLPVTNTNRADAAPKPLDCSTTTSGPVPRAASAEAVSAHLVAQLAANGQHLMLNTPGAAPTPDYNATAWAALSLIQAGHPTEAAGAADWLAGNGYAWAAKGASGTDASAAAILVLTAQASGRDPLNYGGSNILQLLIDAGPAPKSVPPAASAAASEYPKGTKAPGSSITEADDNGGFSPFWLIGVGLLIGIGGGLLLSLQRKRGAHAPGGGKPAAEPAEKAMEKPAAEPSSEPAAKDRPDTDEGDGQK